MSASSELGKSGLKQSIIYFSTVVAGQGMAFLLLPFVTRSMSPAEYGNYSLALAVSTLVGMFASAWLRNVAMRIYFDARDAGRARGFYLSLLVLQAVSFSVLYTLTMTLLTLLGASPAPLGAMVAAGVAMVLGDAAVLTTMLLRAEQLSTAFAAAEITAGAVRFGSTLLGLSLGFESAEMLFIATSVGLALSIGVSVTRLWRKLVGPGEVRWSLVLPVVRHGPAALPFSVADWAERLGDRLIIEYFFNSALVGIYTVGYTIGERTIGLLVKAVSMMAWPGIIAAWQSGGSKEARRAIGEAQWFYAWFATGPAVLLVIYGPDLLRMFVGSEFHSAAGLVPLVAGSMWISGLSTYVNRHMELRKRFGDISAVRTVGAVINIGLNLVLIPRMGMFGAALSTLLSRAISFIIYLTMRDREVTPLPITPIAVSLSWSAICLAAVQLIPGDALIRSGVFAVLYAPAALYSLRRRR